jgi:hypothetical protein
MGEWPVVLVAQMLPVVLVAEWPVVLVAQMLPVAQADYPHLGALWVAQAEWPVAQAKVLVAPVVA